MKIINSQVHFTKDVLSVSEFGGSTDIDDLVKDFKPRHTSDEIVITLKYLDRFPMVRLSDVIRDVPSKGTSPKKPFIKFEGKYYTYADIKKYISTVYEGYTVETPAYNRKKCLNPDRWCKLDHSIMDKLQGYVL